MDLPAEFVAETEAATRGVARELAGYLKPGSVVTLEGDLGAGKTVFVKGLAEGLGGDPAAVVSPTFALIHEYDCPGAVADLIHLDLYRIEDREEELREIGLPEVLFGRIAAVEWPGKRLAELVPIDLRVEIARKGDGTRHIRIERCSG